MKFFEILTQYDLQLEDGSYVDSSDTIFITDDEYSDDLLKELAESVYGEGMKVKTMSVKEVTPEEVTEYYKERIIKQIIPSIYREGFNLPKGISYREYARLCSGPIHHALALKEFEDKYSIYRMLLNHLDLTKISVAELFERIEKVYAARLTDYYLTVFNEAIK